MPALVGSLTIGCTFLLSFPAGILTDRVCSSNTALYCTALTMWLYRANRVAQPVSASNPLVFEQLKKGQLFWVTNYREILSTDFTRRLGHAGHVWEGHPWGVGGGGEGGIGWWVWPPSVICFWNRDVIGIKNLASATWTPCACPRRTSWGGWWGRKRRYWSVSLTPCVICFWNRYVLGIKNLAFKLIN